MPEERKNTGRAEEMLSGLLRHSLRKPRGDAGECASADVLAAYFERSLSAAEMAQAETHFAVCTQCQEQLAAMARIETAMGAAAGTAPARGFSFWNWRWVVPSAAAVMGALAIWVVMRPEMATRTDTASERAAVREPAQTAMSAQAPAVVAPPAGAATPAGPTPAAPAAGEEPKVQGSARKDAARANEELRASSSASVAPAEGVLGKSAAKPDVQALRPAPPPEFAFADRAEKKKEAALAEADEMKRLAADASAERVQTRAAEVQQKTDAQQKSEVAGALRSRDVPRQNPQLAQAPAPAATDQMKAASTVTVDSANTQTREAEAAKMRKQVQEAPPRQGEAGFRPQRSTAPRPKFSAGHGRIEWRFFESGIVQRYDERLKSGDAKELEAVKELLAASSPSEKICWAVGRNGLILRTIDTETWQRIGSPVDEDLIGIEARSAEEAAVRTRSGKTYVTTDGGKTWRTQ